MTIQFTNINPTIDSGSGEAYYFTYNGSEYFVECWSTDNSAGQDIYEVGTGAATHPFESDEDEAEFEEKLEEVQNAFMRAWADLVAEPQRQAIQRALSEVGAPPLDTAGSASRQHYIDTGRYLAEDEREHLARHPFKPNTSGYCMHVGDDGVCMWEAADHEREVVCRHCGGAIVFINAAPQGEPERLIPRHKDELPGVRFACELPEPDTKEEA
jgi:hypothetical protein